MMTIFSLLSQFNQFGEKNINIREISESKPINLSMGLWMKFKLHKIPASTSFGCIACFHKLNIELCKLICFDQIDLKIELYNLRVRMDTFTTSRWTKMLSHIDQLILQSFERIIGNTINLSGDNVLHRPDCRCSSALRELRMQ